jgi:hypothetical protein
MLFSALEKTTFMPDFVRLWIIYIKSQIMTPFHLTTYQSTAR